VPIFETTGLLSRTKAAPALSKRPGPALTGFLITVLLTSFVAATYGFGIYLFSQLVPDMRDDLGFTYGLVGTITAAGQIGFLAFAMGAAWLAPKVGGAQVVIGSVMLCAISLLLLPMTNSVPVMGLLLVVMSGTAASVWVPMVEIVARTISYRHRGKVLGLASSGTSYGVFINSLLVPAFVLNGNWRGVWYAVGTGALAVCAIALFAFWWLGLFQRQPNDAQLAREAAAGQRRGGVFADLREVAAPWVLIIWFITFMNGFSTLPFQNYLAPYLREELGFDVNLAAQVWATIGFVGMFSGFVVGWLSDRTGVRLALLVCYVSIFLSCAILVAIPTGYLPLAAGTLFALAFYPIFGLVPAYVAKRTGGRQATVIFGVANVTLGIGGMIGNYMGGIVTDLTGTFVWIYAAVAASMVVLTLISLLLPPEVKNVLAEETGCVSQDAGSSPLPTNQVSSR
jgi:predicted MFS family arabinose efflux permease